MDEFIELAGTDGTHHVDVFAVTGVSESLINPDVSVVYTGPTSYVVNGTCKDTTDAIVAHRKAYRRFQQNEARVARGMSPLQWPEEPR